MRGTCTKKTAHHYTVQNAEGEVWNGKTFSSTGYGYHTKSGAEKSCKRLIERTGNDLFLVGYDDLGNKVCELWV
jgi:hypothetical protein